MSLNQLVDNILLILRNNSISESEHISRIQIEKWIISYRAMLIKLDIDKQRDINPLYLTTIEPIHLTRVEDAPGKFRYVGDKELPKLIDFNFRSGLIAVRDMFGNLILIGSETKAKLLKYRKYTCGDYIAWFKNNKVYVEGDRNKLEYISIDVIMEDPTQVECYDPDLEFPIPGAMIPTITQTIMEKELRIMTQLPTDDTNDSKDNTLNIYKL